MASDLGTSGRTSLTALVLPPAVALAATAGLAIVSWIVAVRQLTGMPMTMPRDGGIPAGFGSFTAFIALWVPMTAAMMLPGSAVAIARRARDDGRPGTVALFAGAYLGVWALVGVGVHALYRPHGTLVAGAVVIAAGLYELTPPKRHWRRRCSESAGSGVEFGLYCVGSSGGLMLIPVVLNLMSVTWMVVITVVALAQKLLPAKRALDLPLAVLIVGLGVLIALAPTAVPL